MQITNPASPEALIDLKFYMRIISKGKWKIIAFAIFITLLVTVYVFYLPPIYRATSTLLIKTDQENTVSIDSVISLDTSRKDYFLTQFAILQSRTVTEQVIDELKLELDPEFLPAEKNNIIVTQVKNYIKSVIPENLLPKREEDVIDLRSKKVALIKNFQENLSITPIRNTQLVNISYDAKDSALAALIANTVGDVYIRQEMQAQMDITQKAVDWLKLRLEQLRINLEVSVTKLQDYRVQENLIDIESKGVKSIESGELATLTAGYLNAKKARFEAETIYLFVNNVKNNASLLSLKEISDHPLIKDIKAVEIKSEQKVSELSFRYGNKHPKSIAAKAELAAVRKNLRNRVNKLVQGIGEELTAAKDNERRFEEELESAKVSFQGVTNKEEEYLRIKREVEANRKLYGTFLARYKEMESTTNLEVIQARIIDFAEIPASPERPKKALIVLITFIISVIFASILTFLFDSLNDTFRTASEIETKLNKRLLGLLPMIKTKGKRPLPSHVYFDDNYKGFSEAVRSLRTALVLSHFDDNSSVFLITSSIPNEGKTITAINIAYAMTQMKKTLLIEADMRRPSFTKIFNLPPYQEGLSNVISGTEKLDNVIIHDQKSGIDILSAGFIPPNPLELLSSQRFTDMLTALKEKYECIIIDSAPTQAVSDSLVLAQKADSVIYVVRSEMTKQAVVKKGIARLLEVGAKIDGVVLNQVNIQKSAQEEGFQGYYDYYEYGQEQKPSK
ncbi:GumC family protein [Psychromonas sp.]|uniref:GumC family protein n=1 Tax=Psychromonas sp. TaxID=1884585 RepID=UPI0039E39DF4